jgi:predicted acetyltransferase
MEAVRLIKPLKEFENEYRNMLTEWMLVGERMVPFVLEFDCKSFSDFITKLDNCSKGINLPEGFVPHSTFLLVTEGNKILGVSNLRHELSEQLKVKGGHIGYGIRPSARKKGYATEILKLSLREAARFGIKDVLVTCDKSNIGSAKSIVANKGVLVKEHVVDGVLTQNYQISNPFFQEIS